MSFRFAGHSPPRLQWRRSVALQFHRRLQATIEGDSRNRRTSFWIPAWTRSVDARDEHGGILQDPLCRAGLLRQAGAGWNHFLPLGLRALKKLEDVIVKHMTAIGSSQLSLSSLTRESLWRKTGRYQRTGEMLHVQSWKGTELLLAPTHEEEITSLIAAGGVRSHKDVPLRLFQISRKYRDERRPRQGLLRTKEFLMKDLYTFDASPDAALATYNTVREAYSAIFKELNIPIIVTEASSGAMGGSISHEYHLVSTAGEDSICLCKSCGYAANEEVAEKRLLVNAEIVSSDTADSWTGVSLDRSTLVKAYYPSGQGRSIDTRALKEAVPWLDTSTEQNAEQIWRDEPIKQRSSGNDSRRGKQVLFLIDARIAADKLPDRHNYARFRVSEMRCHPETGASLDLTRIKSGDGCPRCVDGRLEVRTSVELGHTFHLGTRYSKVLNAAVDAPEADLNACTEPAEGGQISRKGRAKTFLEMGCHGIGLSRLIAAVSTSQEVGSSGKQSVFWPRSLAPFQVCIVPEDESYHEIAEQIYDSLSRVHEDSAGTVDALLDDRTDRRFRYKMAEASNVGYPVIVVLSRGWAKEQLVSVECPMLGVDKKVPLADVRPAVQVLLQSYEEKRLSL